MAVFSGPSFSWERHGWQSDFLRPAQRRQPHATVVSD